MIMIIKWYWINVMSNECEMIMNEMIVLKWWLILM